MSNRPICRFRRIVLLAGGVLLAGLFAPALRADLPAFCDYTKDGKKRDPIVERKYREYYGATFNHMHHYCRGLKQLQVAMSSFRDKQARDHAYSRAIVEFNYVLDRAEEDFPLVPEIETKKAMALLALGEDAEALRVLNGLIQTHPQYAPPYLLLSNYFVRTGETDQARKLLELASERIPESGLIRKKLGELQGPPNP